MRAVNAAFAVVEAEEVLRHRVGARRATAGLQPGHVRGAERRGEGRVLAVGLALSSHPGVA